MNQLFQQRQQATRARKAGDFQTALGLYRQIWYGAGEDRSAWDGWGYAKCLYQQHDYVLALSIIQESRQLTPELKELNDLEAWCRYHLAFKADPVPKDLDTQALTILALSDPQDPYSPYQRTVFKMLSHYSEPYQKEPMGEWLSRLDAANLSKESEVYQERKLPSMWLRYMGKLTEFQLQNGDYEACLKSCQSVLAAPTQEVPRNQRIWFERRQARSQVALKQYLPAIQIYQRLLKQKPEWFLFKELAEAHFYAGEPEAALQAGLEAALSKGELEKKIHVFDLLSRCLNSLQQADLAQRCLELIVLIRREQNWSMPQALQAVSHQLNSQLKVADHWPILRRDLQALRPKETREPPSQKQKGVIKTLLPNGQAGFIRLQDGRDVYFKTRDARSISELKAGLKIECEVKEGFDPKKQRASLIAVRVRGEGGVRN